MNMNLFKYIVNITMFVFLQFFYFHPAKKKKTIIVKENSMLITITTALMTIKMNPLIFKRSLMKT